jgi:DNA-binding response OmpR family regulator
MSKENLSSIQQIDVMIVDDVPDNLYLLTTILKKHNYNIRLARDAKIALRSIRAKRPFIILLDVQLPGMDGFELCRILKEDDSTKGIPVIFLTVHTSSENRMKGFEAGGVDYITKPIMAEEVLARVNTHVKLRELKLEEEQLNIELKKEIEVHKV